MTANSDAPGEVVDLASRKPRERADWMKLLATSGDPPTVLPTVANVMLLLAYDPALSGMLAYNTFTLSPLLLRAPPPREVNGQDMPGPYPRAWDGADITMIHGYLQRTWCSRFSRESVEHAMIAEATMAQFHPILGYLGGLKWDQEPRLDIWLTETFGCPCDAYHKAVGSKLLIAAVRRVRSPGCKYDQFVVLEGPQRLGKSTAVAILFDPWYADRISDLASKDAAIDLRGKWAIELAEIDRLIKAHSAETVKAFASRAIDHYRPPYGRVSIDVPRQSVMIGTTNEQEYLVDPTGNFRFLPVKCLSNPNEGANLVWLRSNRDQLWAEAAERETKNETLWLDDISIRDTAAKIQASRLVEDPWHQKIKDHVEKLLSDYEDAQLVAESDPDPVWVTVPDLCEKVLYVLTDKQTKSVEMRVGAILKILGWKKHRVVQKLDSGRERRLKVWVPPGGDNEQ